jgi:hypothetical protein
MKKALSFVLAAVFAVSFFVFAQADVTTTFYGFQWLRYDYQQYGGSYASTPSTSNNTFSIPRTYLRFKASDPDAGYEGNITMDINNTNNGEAGNIDWASWLKYAYVDFTKIPFLSDIGATVRAGQQAVYFGTIDTWQFPTIEKSIEDKNGVMNGCDNGVSIVGKIPSGFGTYQAAVYNGTGYKTIAYDSNQNITDKAYDLSVNLTPISNAYLRISYFHKLTNAINAMTQAYNATAIVLGGNAGPVEGFVEYLTANEGKNYVTGTSSGVIIGWESYVGVKLTDYLQMHLRVDTYDPDTRVHNNETNTYIAGFNVMLTKKTTLQLDYEFNGYKFPFAGGAKDNNITNNNQFISQLVWSW